MDKFNSKIDMSTIQIHYAWALQQFSQLNKLFVPKEIIVFIANLCKPKFIFFVNIPTPDYPKTKKQLDITQNLKYGYFKSKPQTFYGRVTLRKSHPKNVYNDLTLKNFFLQNNITGIKKNIESYNMNLIITKCNRVIIYKMLPESFDSDSEDDSDSQHDFHILENSIKILDFHFRTDKIFVTPNFIMLRSMSGIFYYFAYDAYGNDYCENYKSVVEIPIRNIKKIICLSFRCIILTTDGYVWISDGLLPSDFKQVKITNVINIYYGTYLIFLTRIGDIYSCRMDHLETVKINLNKVLCVYMRYSFCIALTCNYDVYMWGNIQEGMKLIQSDLGKIGNVPSESNVPIFIDKIIFDEPLPGDSCSQ